MQGKYHEFATILRQHNVSGHENAFDKLVNLFLAKLVDEKRNGADLLFHWKGVAYDNAYDLQDRLQRLYTSGMKDFLGETVTYIDEQTVRKAFRRFERDPDATKDAILEYFRQLKFYTNNDFAFLDVHNARLFEENFAILLKIVRMLEDVRLLTDTPNQFLGDLFEGFLDRGVKQSEGQFFTPLPIVRFIVSSLPLQELVRDGDAPPRVVDYACGAGHFLNEYAQQIKPFLAAYAPDAAREHHGAIYGIEKEYRLSKVAKVAAFMYGEDDMRIVYADALARRADVPDASFDLLVANPPYSVRGFLATLSEEDRNRYELSGAVPSGSLESFNGIETFFVERAAQLLKPCGIAAVILPSSILSNGAAAYLRCRDILLRVFDIVAIAEFGSGTFGKTGTNTVTLFLRKKDAPPDFAAHCANRADAWLAAKHGGDEVFQDAAALDRYCAKRGFSPTDYRAFLAADAPERVPPAILTHDAVRALLADFAKRTARQKWTDAECAAEELKFLRTEERERLRVFLLADANPVPVLLVKMPADTKEAKAFLGYEWSARKGNEGIKYLGAADAKGAAGRSGDTPDGDDAIARNRGIEAIRTPLFDNAHLANEETEKLNSLVRKNFRAAITAGTENAAPVPAIPDSLRAFARTVPLADLLDFDATTFDRQIRTGATASAAPVRSKFPMVRLGDVAEIVRGVTFDKNDQVLEATGNVVLTADNITLDGRFQVEKKVFLRADLTLPAEKRLRSGDCFMCFASGSKKHVGKVCFISEDTDYFAGGFMGMIRSNGKIIPRYLHEILNAESVRNVVRQTSTGTNIQNLSSSISTVAIPLPPLAVQQKVVDACAAVDAECAAAEKIIADGKAKIADLFAAGQNAHAAMVKLADTSRFSLQIGRRVLGTQVSPDFSIPVFSANVFEPFGMIDKPLKGFSDFSTDSVLWGIDGDWMVGFMPKGKPFYPTDHCGVLRSRTDDIVPRYLVHALEEAGKAAGFKRSYRASIDRIQSLSIALPPRAEQEKIVAAVEAEEAAIAAAKEVLAAAPTRKAAILANYGVIEAIG